MRKRHPVCSLVSRDLCKAEIVLKAAFGRETVDEAAVSHILVIGVSLRQERHFLLLFPLQPLPLQER